MVGGKFIVFEGIDGSGTSTQARLLVAALRHRGYAAALTSEPSNGPVGHLIRQIHHGRLHVSNDPRQVDRALAYLFAADRFDHLHNQSDGVFTLIQNGTTVVSTRYWLSSFAYHVHDEDDYALVRSLNANFPPPDLTLFLECQPTEAICRISSSGRIPDRNENLETLRRVDLNYARALQSYAARLVRLIATTSEPLLHQEVLRVVLDTMEHESHDRNPVAGLLDS